MLVSNSCWGGKATMCCSPTENCQQCKTVEFCYEKAKIVSLYPLLSYKTFRTAVNNVNVHIRSLFGANLESHDSLENMVI
jgi:hypothetical protein